MKFNWVVICLCFLLSRSMAEEPMFRLGVNASFDDGVMRVLSVDPGGPGANLQNDKSSGARLEPNDIIEEVDGRPVRSYGDLVDILNRSSDGYVALTIRDINTGDSAVWYALAVPTASTQYELTRDAMRRAVRNREVPLTEFFFRDGPGIASSNITSVIRPIGQDSGEKSGEEVFRETLSGVACIQQHAASARPLNVFSREAFEQCDRLLGNAYGQMLMLGSTEDKRALAEGAQSEVLSILRASLFDWAERNGRKVVEKATTPNLVTFNVKVPDGYVGVQLLLASEKAVQLSSKGLAVRPVSESGRQFLSTAVTWESIPLQDARAYGRYYYRLIKVVDGRFKPEEFDENRSVVIKSAPPNNELFFQ